MRMLCDMGVADCGERDAHALTGVCIESALGWLYI